MPESGNFRQGKGPVQGLSCDAANILVSELHPWYLVFCESHSGGRPPRKCLLIS